MALRSGALKLTLPNLTSQWGEALVTGNPTKLLSASVIFGAYGTKKATTAERLATYASGGTANVSAGVFFAGGVVVSNRLTLQLQ